MSDHVADQVTMADHSYGGESTGAGPQATHRELETRSPFSHCVQGLGFVSPLFLKFLSKTLTLNVLTCLS